MTLADPVRLPEASTVITNPCCKRPHLATFLKCTPVVIES